MLLPAPPKTRIQWVIMQSLYQIPVMILNSSIFNLRFIFPPCTLVTMGVPLPLKTM